jgi:charged multivesicular body protein 2A
MGAMNRGLNLPQIQRIMHEFEKESATMDMKEEMMSDAVDDVMDEGLEDEEEESDKILKQVLDEIGVDLSQQVRSLRCDTFFALVTDPFRLQLTDAPTGLAMSSPLTESRQAVAIGEGGASGDHGGGTSDEDALQARLDALRRG